ncbi:c-type cytochrome [Thiobaca trueperi]|uniref:Cytochrome c553 n=1 Tax=Thiobaca trueperi TaxID=127458 RepID=A0A4R3MXJ6_9GAMM|nr:c-type cytochrome [Thiobaca trueperi]TCT19473.1 cytochrome c553 [Thiobaca trueperi]
MRSDHHPAIIAFGLTLGLSATSLQAAPDAHQVRAWAASCAACHGTDGQAQQGAVKLAGRNGEELYKMLLAFKAGERPATVMQQHAKGYTDEELKLLAGWFAAQPDR